MPLENLNGFMALLGGRPLNVSQNTMERKNYFTSKIILKKSQHKISNAFTVKFMLCKEAVEIWPPQSIKITRI
jgi:hypothetical protein